MENYRNFLLDAVKMNKENDIFRKRPILGNRILVPVRDYSMDEIVEKYIKTRPTKKPKEVIINKNDACIVYDASIIFINIEEKVIEYKREKKMNAYEKRARHQLNRS
tara:strand:- start:686 stop:1006 length:321 start_codon:yes stop_codon:yes gene_type:complete